jgi:hypothetical protein
MAPDLHCVLRASQRTLCKMCPTLGWRIAISARMLVGSQILMANYSRHWSAALASLMLAVYPCAAANDGGGPGTLAVVVHKMSKFDNVSLLDLRRMFTGDLRAWPDSSLVVVIEQPADSPTQQRTIRILLKTTPINYNRQLLQTHFQGKLLPTIKVLNSDASAIRFVLNLPGAVAVVDGAAAMAAPAGVKILRIGGKLPGETGYPLQ